MLLRDRPPLRFVLACAAVLAGPGAARAQRAAPSAAAASPAPVRTGAATASGAASLPALRQAYLDAMRAHSVDALDALYDWTGVPATLRGALHRHLAASVALPVTAATLGDPDPGLSAEYARSHVHFPVPVVKTLDVRYATNAQGETGVQYYVGRRGDRFYLVTGVPDAAP